MKANLLISAVALGIGLSATAAYAAPPPPPPPHISFGLTLGNGQDNGPPPDNQDCLSTKEILGGLHDQGYRHFTNLDDSDDNTLTLDAQRGPKWYELDVDNCSGDITDRTRIKFPG